MYVKTMCYNNIIFIEKNLNLTQAVEEMQRHGVERLLIVDSNNSGQMLPCGILTYRDIITKVIAMGKCLKKIIISEIMTKDFLIVEENEKISAIQRLIERFKNFVVISAKNKKIIGVISSNDLIFNVANDLVNPV